MATVDTTNPLLTEAAQIAELHASSVFGKPTVDGPSKAKETIVESIVFRELFRNHPKVSISTLHHAAAYGASIAARDWTSGGLPSAGIVVPGLSEAEQAAKATASAATATAHALGMLTDPYTYLRAVYIVGGSVLLLSGIFIIARELGARNIPKPITPATYAVGAFKKSAKKGVKGK
jgi:hypothetical protein